MWCTEADLVADLSRGPVFLKWVYVLLSHQIFTKMHHHFFFVCLNRSEGASPTQLADKVEKAVRERLEPLLDKAQVMQSKLMLTFGRVSLRFIKHL